jgi:hypothetical protein
MSQHLYNIWLALQDGWQNVALIVLLADRAVSRRRTKRLVRDVDADSDAPISPVHPAFKNTSRAMGWWA